MHGIGGGEVNYRYKYSEQDLKNLLTIVRRALEKSNEVFMLFNNVYSLGIGAMGVGGTASTALAV